jgi:hypothetical protein
VILDLVLGFRSVLLGLRRDMRKPGIEAATRHSYLKVKPHMKPLLLSLL